MNQLYKLLIGAAAIALVSCGNEEIEPDMVRDCPAFSAMIDGQLSRAVDDYWEPGDKIGVSGGEADNVCHVTPRGEPDFTPEDPSEQIYFPDAEPVEYTAYYPYYSDRDATTGLINFSAADQADQKDFDFLWATATGSKNSPDVEFLFFHRMSKLTLIFKNGNDMDVSALTRCRLNGLLVDGVFDTGTGICMADDTKATASTTLLLTDVREDMEVTPLFLIPQTVAGQLKLEIYDNNNQYYVGNLTVPGKEFVTGTNYTYTITVSKTGLKVTGASISDWIEKTDDSEASSADE